MKIILLSGGSGKRLWPLSNDARSKQFLRLLDAPGGGKESMIQRIVRQIREARLADEIVVATGISQKDAIENQLGSGMAVVTEPCRRGTFPAIALACLWLAETGTPADEPIIVMPCDTYADNDYFCAIRHMAEAVERDAASLVLMGITPVYPSAKYGYIVPATAAAAGEAKPVKGFTEKPDVAEAEALIAEGAQWNGGAFAFRLGYLTEAARNAFGMDYAAMRAAFCSLEKSSFDRAVVEQCRSLAVVHYPGAWKDLGTWNTLTDELRDPAHGNVVTEGCESTYIINELEMPLVCIGARNLVVAASPDGILVSERKLSENLKHLVDGLDRRPMYEERRWGEYKVIDSVEFADGFCALTKQLTLRPGCSISYQRHGCRTEVWTFIDGEGEIVLDGVRRPVGRGDVVNIPCGQMHALRATTALTFIEVQQGSNLVEEDIERFPYEW